MDTKRRKIPEDVAAHVLFLADRTCCICNEAKEVQIHHINENPSSNTVDNLAVLCFDCHGKTQLKGGFGRKLDAAQVRLYRDHWHSTVEQRRERLVSLNEEQFRDFRPHFTQHGTRKSDEVQSGDLSDLEQERASEYQRNCGLFLVHYWSPSTKSKQVVDLVIRLHQHNLGPLGEEEVESVEYQLGPRFSTKPLTVEDSTNNFELEVSAYSPVLCLARVNFIDNRMPLKLFRYIDFPTDE